MIITIAVDLSAAHSSFKLYNIVAIAGVALWITEDAKSCTVHRFHILDVFLLAAELLLLKPVNTGSQKHATIYHEECR